ncbi:MAG TPA: TetR/AcrR family transcriptional regulator [Candidatus Eremiobacteraceae bacterium]|nr:TetR/AcrR family transcriptional regulator [Candidatus Eremiobacteraceae bacterium]
MSYSLYCLLAFQVMPMAGKLRTNPRKMASQERSHLTVEALLEATARILVKNGYDRASTNRIAEAAGVSIGSLYQYFPSKEALVAAVIDRHSQGMMHVLREALVKVAMRPIEEAARELVRVMIDAHRVNPKLHRVLAEQVPRVGRLDNIQAIDREAFALVRAYLEAHRDELHITDTNMAAFVCVTTVEALTHAAVVHRHEALSDDRADAFVGEVTALILRYLKPGRVPEARAAPKPLP